MKKKPQEKRFLCPGKIRRQKAFFLTSQDKSNIMKGSFEQSNGGQGVLARSLRLLTSIRRQVMAMSEYEITMILIAALTLMLKRIEFILNQSKK